MHATAAVLLEDSFLRDVLQEFATRDTNRDGDLSNGKPDFCQKKVCKLTYTHLLMEPFN